MAVVALDQRLRIEEVVTERLEAEICEVSGQIAAATARLVLMIAEYDRRQGWADWGCRSAAHWLSWKCGVGMHAAREKLRVGHALAALPLIRAAFERGELSYSQVRSITRIAGPHNEAALVDIARASTAGVSDRLCKRRHCCLLLRFNYLMCVNSAWVRVRGSRSRTGVARGSNL